MTADLTQRLDEEIRKLAAQGRENTDINPRSERCLVSHSRLLHIADLVATALSAERGLIEAQTQELRLTSRALLETNQRANAAEAALSTFTAREAVLVGALKPFSGLDQPGGDREAVAITVRLEDLRGADNALAHLSSRATDLMAVVRAVGECSEAYSSNTTASMRADALRKVFDAYESLARLKSGERT